ncbi:TIGR04376 family protein [Myxosarcina sp. GI1(2024)]
MGLFDDLDRFLEERLDEFLSNNPHLELQAIEEQLREQERDAQKIITELQLEEKSLQDKILAIAKDIQTWHGRVSKAESANRPDLAKAAQEREAALLRQGNQAWGQMQGVKNRIIQAKELLQQVRNKRRQIETELAKVKASRTTSNTSSYTVGWDRGASNNYSRASDPLEAEFQKWELDAELEEMKKNMNR